MLTPAPPSVGSIPSNAIQIVINAVTSQVLYTVPVGKKFIGYAFNAGNMQLIINSIQTINSSSNTGLSYPLTLVSGTIVSCGGSYAAWVLIGIELDNNYEFDKI